MYEGNSNFAYFKLSFGRDSLSSLYDFLIFLTVYYEVILEYKLRQFKPWISFQEVLFSGNRSNMNSNKLQVQKNLEKPSEILRLIMHNPTTPLFAKLKLVLQSL